MKHFRNIILAFFMSLVLFSSSMATISSEDTPRVQYTANGITTNFPITFTYASIADVHVYFISNSTGLATAWTKDASGPTGYTVSAGAIVANTAPSNGYLVAVCTTPVTQLVDVKPNRALTADTLEGVFDKLTLIGRDLKGSVSRSLIYGPTYTGSIPYAEDLADEIQQDSVDASVAAVNALTFATSLHIDNIAALRLFPGGETTSIYLDCHTSQLDGGHGPWDWDADSTATDNNGTVIQVTGIATGRWIRQLNGFITPRMFGAVGDGATDDSDALISLSAAIVDNTTVDFEGLKYLISASGTPSSPYGHRIFDLDDLEDITFKGNNCKIIVSNHNIATNQGIVFLWASRIRGFKASGFNFDMTFTGVNTNANYYPFCGALIGFDADGAVFTQDELNGNWDIKDCTFKMYHPYGSYAQSGAPYLGDPNNGFKVIPIFARGPYQGASYANQCRNINMENCTLLDGHNGYGFWAWAWNDVVMQKCTAENFVSKQSNAAGVISGVGEPMLRYHQFLCSGVKVINNTFRAKPCSERLVAGFEGDARFFDYNTNSATGPITTGNCIVANNTIIGGRGDAANAYVDNYIYLFGYGSINVSGNTFDETLETTNAVASTGISWNGQSRGYPIGSSILTITGNTWNASCKYMNNIQVSNGNTISAAVRELKQLNITGNNSYAQYQYFLNVLGTSTYYGVADINVSNNMINGANSFYNSASTNSRAIQIASSELTDIAQISRNIIRDKYYGVSASSHNGTTYSEYNKCIDVNTRHLGTKIYLSEIGINAPTFAALPGSIFIRTNGIAGNVLYVYEPLGWTPK